LLFCDVDGTLTGRNGRGHSARLLPLMRQLMARGVKIGIVSGRDSLSARVVHRLFDLNGPIIAENGAEIILHPAEVEPKTKVYGGLPPSQLARLKRRIAVRGLRKRMWIDPEKKRMLTLYPKSFPHHKPEELLALSRRVAKVLGDSPSDLEITCSSAAIDICARGADKGHGISAARRSMRIAPSSVAFVGDSRNDQSAFEIVRRGHGWLAFVGGDRAFGETLRDYPRAYFPRRRAAEGSADFLRFLLKNALLSG
jgi:HAD superfamily hydrolase (TIGR01484 family)